MNYFNYHENELYIEKIKVADLAELYGTPCYVYSQNIIEDNWKKFAENLEPHPHRICYAVKANSNIAILNILAKLGSGFDIVSVGELERVLIAGGDKNKIIFSGVGKQPHEIRRALDVGIFCFNVESEPELKLINTIAKNQNQVASIALRINPNIDAGTHPHIATGLQKNKFGISYQKIPDLIKKLPSYQYLKLIGIACHIGSQITELNPFLQAAERLNEIKTYLLDAGIAIKHINMGGGLAISYQNEKPPPINNYVSTLREKFTHFQGEIILEPGRAIVGDAGILLTRIEYLKFTEDTNFAIVDAGMNDFMRPVLYDAWHNILPTRIRNEEKKSYSIVGPICETGDFFAKERHLAIHQYDWLAISQVGAYGFCMSSQYNSRPRVAEILVKDEEKWLIRKRESISDLFANESLPYSKDEIT